MRINIFKKIIKLITSIVTLIRLKDWLKNIIIFLPLIFSGNLRYENFYLDLFITFILFSLTASFIYIINDIVDINEDKKHNLKIFKKPLASGKITKSFAKILLFLILFILIGAFFKYKSIYPYLILYALLNISYSLYFKKIPIIDVILISIGYLIRLDVGSLVINVNTSIYLAGTIFFLASFIIFIKRVVEYKNYSNIKRFKLFYNEFNLSILIFISAVLFFLTLIIFVLTVDIKLLILVPLLILIFYRYYRSAISYKLGEFPLDLVIKDKIILFTSSLVMIYTMYVYY